MAEPPLSLDLSSGNAEAGETEITFGRTTSILSHPESPSNGRERFDADGNLIQRRKAGETPRHGISFRDEKTEDGITDVQEVTQYKDIQLEQPEVNGNNEVTCYFCTLQ